MSSASLSRVSVVVIGRGYPKPVIHARDSVDMAKKNERPRVAARRAQRFDEKLAEARQKLFCAVPGGAADRPLEVSTAALVEPRAGAVRCPLCAGELRVKEHEAATHGGVSLRVLAMACFLCGGRQSLYFRIVAPLPSLSLERSLRDAGPEGAGFMPCRHANPAPRRRAPPASWPRC